MATRFSDITNPNAPRTEPQSWDRLKQMFGLSFQPADGSAPVPSNWGWDQQSWEAAGGGNNSGFFGGLGDIFSWGGGNEPPPTPQFNPATQVPISAREGTLPPPNIPRMPPVPQGSGTSTPWGGQPNAYDMTTAEDAMMPPVEASQGMEQAAPKAYSFMDNPGASDAMVAFGAAMLKAPSFNQGLGDAALAVNQVARSYRMPTEADYAKARQLGMIKQIASGRASTPGGVSVDRSNLYRDDNDQTWFDATGPNNEAGLYNQDTGQFTTGGVPGLRRDIYDYGMNRSKRLAGKDADIEAEFVEKIPGIAKVASQFNELYNLASDDTTAIDSSFSTRVARQLTQLSPEIGAKLTGLDPDNITEFNNRIQNVALDYASSAFKGQGQVTENERAMIKEAVGQPGTLTKASAMLIFKIMRDAEIRKLKMYQTWSRDANLRDNYGGSFSRYQADVITNVTLEQMQSPTGGSAPTASGNSAQPPANPELEDALNRYPGN